GGGIRGTNNRVWWFPRVDPMFTDLTPVDFCLWGYLKHRMPPLRQHCGTFKMLRCVKREIQSRIEMCIVADGEKFEHRK
ncbi:hypothetical protein AVEN_61235-1, partial [Araneus ventricosus]